MPYFKWDESYSIGHDEIDRQHQEWIAIINRVHAALVGDDETELNELTRNALQSIKDYGKKHFAYEEELLRKVDYPETEEHLRMHSQFANQIDMWIKEEEEKGMSILNSQLMKVMKNWLQTHIKAEDKKIQEYIDKK